jgi:hypothetical protein
MRGRMKIIVMENFNSILFHNFGLANKQHRHHNHHYQQILKKIYTIYENVRVNKDVR